MKVSSRGLRFQSWGSRFRAGRSGTFYLTVSRRFVGFRQSPCAGFLDQLQTLHDVTQVLLFLEERTRRTQQLKVVHVIDAPQGERDDVINVPSAAKRPWWPSGDHAPSHGDHPPLREFVRLKANQRQSISFNSRKHTLDAPRFGRLTVARSVGEHEPRWRDRERCGG